MLAPTPSFYCNVTSVRQLTPSVLPVEHWALPSSLSAVMFSFSSTGCAAVESSLQNHTRHERVSLFSAAMALNYCEQHRSLQSCLLHSLPLWSVVNWLALLLFLATNSKCNEIFLDKILRMQNLINAVVIGTFDILFYVWLFYSSYFSQSILGKTKQNKETRTAFQV